MRAVLDIFLESSVYFLAYKSYAKKIAVENS
mgnify:CR=1 FL=1